MKPKPRLFNKKQLIYIIAFTIFIVFLAGYQAEGTRGWQDLSENVLLLIAGIGIAKYVDMIEALADKKTDEDN